MKQNKQGVLIDNSDKGLAFIRLECLRLAHRPDLGPDEAVKRATVYEAYITKGEQADNGNTAR